MIDLGSLVLVGTNGAKARLLDATEEATRERRIDEASKLVLDVRDASKALVRSGLLDQRCWIDLDGNAQAYELDIVSRSTASAMQLTFVDSVAAKLMRPGGSTITATAGTTTRGAFLQRLAREAGVPATIDPALFKETNGEDLTRGLESDPKESSWSASLSIVDAVQARRFTDGKRLVAGSDAWLLGRFKALEVRENERGVGTITWDLDDKGVSSATLEVRTGQWAVPAGYPVRLVNEGPASGLWLVESVQDSASSITGSVTLTRKQALLDEPVPEAPGDAGETGRTTGSRGSDPGGLGSAAVERAIAWGRAHAGASYGYGKTGPSAYDCSAYTRAMAAAGGVSLPRTAGEQRDWCAARQRLLPVSTALATRGALLFNIGGGRGASGNHVAMSLGGGSTIEARGRGDGIGIFTGASARGWTAGGVIF